MMCHVCWQTVYGRSEELPEGWELGVEMIKMLYEREETGGLLHVEIDDMNIEEDWKPWQVPDEMLVHDGVEKYDEETMAIAQEISEFMKDLTIPQRAAVVAKWEGWF